MKTGSCVHFNGVQNECCRAGVTYENLTGSKVLGWGLMLPCWTSTMKHAKDVVKVACDKYSEPTAKQIADDEADTEAIMERIRKVMVAVGAWRVATPPPQDRREVIVCPACAGRLHLSQSSYNGHVHGSCETEGCARWME